MKILGMALSLAILTACNTTVRASSGGERNIVSDPETAPDVIGRMDDFAQSQVTAEAKLLDKGVVSVADQGGKKVTSWKAKFQNLHVTSVGQENLQLDWSRAAKVVLVSPEIDNGCSMQAPFGISLKTDEVSVAGVDIPAEDQFTPDEKGLPTPVDNALPECKEAIKSFETETLTFLVYNVPAVTKGKPTVFTVKLDLRH